MTLKAITDVLLFIAESGLVLAGILALLIWVRDKTRRISYERLLVQLVSFLAIFSTVVILGQWNWLVLGSILLLTVFFGRFWPFYGPPGGDQHFHTGRFTAFSNWLIWRIFAPALTS